MIDKQSQYCRARRAIAAAQVALAMTAVLGVAAIALDGGMLLTERRHVQAAADAAALAAATNLYIDFSTNRGADSSGSAAAAARDYVTNNYAAAFRGNLQPVTVNIPPSSAQSLPAHRTNGYVEVIVQYNQPRLFSGIFGGGSIPISARAVAQGTWLRPLPAVLALNPSANPGLKVAGSGVLTVNGGGLVGVNSTAIGAVQNTGGGTINTGGGLYVSGTVSGGGTYNPPPNTGTPPIPDPYAYVPTPSQPPAGTIKQRSKNPVVWDVYPGSFVNLQSFGSSDTVYFHEASSNGNGGIYYLVSGGLKSSSSASLLLAKYDPSGLYQAESGGIMFYDAGTTSSDAITLNSAGAAHLVGLSSGSYQGLVIFQARNAPENLSISGNGNFILEGTIYAPDAEIDLTGNGSGNVIGSSVIGNSLKIAGNGNILVDYNSSSVLNTRTIRLVE